MTLRLAVVSTSPNTNDIINILKAEYSDEIKVVTHFGTKENDFKASSLSRVNHKNGVKGHIVQNHRWSAAAHKLIQSSDFIDQAEMFIDQMDRHSNIAAYKSHSIGTTSEYYDYYHILLDCITAHLLEKKIEAVLFFNVPHLAYDTVLYQCAKALNIQTIILTQTIFSNKFISLRGVDSLGDLNRNHICPPHTINTEKRIDLFYMKGIKQEAGQKGRFTLKGAMSLFVFLLTKRPLKALNPLYIASLIKKMNKAYQGLPKWRDPFANFFHEDTLPYFDHIAGFEDQEVDLSGDFVYFPLQLQPEMTTSSLGGRFRDQAYAIECLAEKLPSNMRILVKENPKQGGYMRGPMFFHRLRRIPNVVFLPSWANTHELREKSKFVASITGTIGWEAIHSGKPALVFGKAWYRKFEGVYEWSDDFKIEDILSHQVDHSTLEQDVGCFLASCNEGVIDRHYQKIVPDFDKAANDAKVAKCIYELLVKEKSTTF